MRFGRADPREWNEPWGGVPEAENRAAKCPILNFEASRRGVKKFFDLRCNTLPRGYVASNVGNMFNVASGCPCRGSWGGED